MTETYKFQYALVVKSARTSNNSTLGYLTPIAIGQHGDETFVPYIKGSNEPYSDDIFVERLYDLLADIEIGQPFKIRCTDASNRHDPSRGNAAGYCQYICQGDKADQLSKNELMHIVDLPVEFGISVRSVIMPFKPERNILLRSSGYLYGPFEYGDPDIVRNGESFDVRIQSSKPSPWLQSKSPHSVYRFTCKTFKTIRIKTGECLLSSLSDLATWKYEEVDFITDDQLIELAKKIFAADNVNARHYFNTLRSQLKDFRSEPHAFNLGRRDRLASMFDQLQLGDSDELFLRFLDTDNGRQSLDAFISSHPAQILEQAKEHFGQELHKNRIVLEDDINLARNTSRNLNSENISLASELDRLKNLKKEGAKIVEQLEAQAKSLNQKISSLKSKETELSLVAEALRCNISADQSEMLSKIVGLKPYLDLLVNHNPNLEERAQSSSSLSSPTRLGLAVPQYPFTHRDASDSDGNGDIFEVVRGVSRAFKQSFIAPDDDWLAIKVIAAFAVQLPITIYGPAAPFFCGQLSKSLFGEKHINKNISRMLIGTPELFGRFDTTNSYFIPDAERLSDLTVTQHLSNEAHLISFDGFNRCDCEAVFAPFLVADIGDKGILLSITHHSALAQSDAYRHLANAFWPRHFFTAFVHSPVGDRPPHSHWTRTVALCAEYMRSKDSNTIPRKRLSETLPYFSISQWNSIADRSANYSEHAANALRSVTVGDENALDRADECGINPIKFIQYCSTLIYMRGKIAGGDASQSDNFEAAQQTVNAMLLPSLIDYDMDLPHVNKGILHRLNRVVRGY